MDTAYILGTLVVIMMILLGIYINVSEKNERNRQDHERK